MKKKKTPSHAVGMNITDLQVTFEIGSTPGVPLDKYTLKPGQKVKLRHAYLFRRRNGEGAPVPSIVDNMTNGAVVPVGADGAPLERIVWPPGTPADGRVQPRRIPKFEGKVEARAENDINGIDDVVDEQPQRKAAAG